MTSRLFTPLNLVLIVLLLAAAAWGFLGIPAGKILPTHWGFDGTPDAFMPRDFALLVPIGIAAALFVLFELLGRYGSKGRVMAGAGVLGAAATALLLLCLGIEAATVLIGLGYAVSMVQVISFALAAFLILVGNALPTSQPNGFAGVRIPSTLRDPANWQATHRLTGLLMVIGGAALAVAAPLLPPTLPLFIAMLAAVVLPVAIGVIYSVTRAA